MGNPSEDVLIEVLKENWEHIRHLENERLWFTNIYAAIVAGVFGFTSQAGIGGDVFRALLIFLIFLSIIGIAIAVKLSYEYHKTMEKMEKIALVLNIDKEYIFAPVARLKEGRLWRYCRTATFVSILYGAVMVICISLLLKL